MMKWLSAVFFLLIFPDLCQAFLPAAAIPAASASGPAAPFVIGGIAAFTAITSLWRNPNGALKVQLTTIYNDAQEGLEENLARYLEEAPSLLAQKERLAYFDKIWAELKVESLKTAQGIISWNERQRNGRWCWECYFRDPIANDPRLNVSINLPPVQSNPPVISGSPPNGSVEIDPGVIGPSVPQFLAIIIAMISVFFILTRS